MRVLFTLTILIVLFSCPVMAQGLSGDVDLILPPGLQTPDAPFYRGASVKIGEKIFPVKEASTTNGQLVQFQPENNQVVVSDAANTSEEAKGEALLNTVTALQASAIATAAGQ